VSGRILVVDDDASIRQTFREHLTEAGYEVATAESAEAALGRVAGFDPGVVVTDVRMPDMSGIELLERLHEARPDITVLVITAHEDMSSAVRAMRAGAYDYLVKPLDLDHIDVVIGRAFRDRTLRRRAEQLAGEAAGPYSLDQLVGRDPAMIEIYKLIGTLATTRTPVLIRGETGTGKEVIARSIHYHSPDAAEPFVAVNCTALPEPLLESELFGHVKGAFTGAAADRRGRFEMAGSGTLFLDEVGDVSPAFQAKLLRVIQEHEYQPVGSERARRTEARIMAATHRPLEELVANGEFREDLYFRLRVVEIQVPPLRQRPGDIPLLAEFLAGRIARTLHRSTPVIPDAVADALQAYDWPGNVRELENALTRAMVLARGPALALENLSLGELTTATRGSGTGTGGGSGSRGSDGRGAHGGHGPDGARPADEVPGDESLAEAERTHLVRVLRRTGGNKRQAARLLRISRPRLDRLIDRHGLVVTEYGRDGIVSG
jgi:DNA-binding NtrC family response regulator